MKALEAFGIPGCIHALKWTKNTKYRLNKNNIISFERMIQTCFVRVQYMYVYITLSKDGPTANRFLLQKFLLIFVIVAERF